MISSRGIDMGNRTKYRNDAEYRKKQLIASTNWNKTHREQLNKKSKERYAKRTPEQIKQRQQKLKKMRALGKWKMH